MNVMYENIGVSVSRSKHKGSGAVLPQHDPFEDRRLNSAYVEQVGALRSYPEPRHLWANVASGGRLPHKGKMAVACGKIAVRAAIATGNMATIEETAHRVERYFDACKAAAIADYTAIADGVIGLDDAMVRASKETTEALHAILAASVNEATSDLTVREIDEAILALGACRSQMVAKEAAQNRRALALS